MNYRFLTVWLISLLTVFAWAHPRAKAANELLRTPHSVKNFGVWRLTNDPTVRDHANYHNTQCFSPDGRYVCYTHWRDGGSKGSATIHVIDLLSGMDYRIGQGIFPRWAKQHNWLFYVSYKRRPSSLTKSGSCVMWLDLEGNQLTMLVDGPESISGTDFGDRWLYGALRNRKQRPQFRAVRIPIRQGAQFELLPDVVGNDRLPNPRHPVFFTRSDHDDEPFDATRFWYDLNGSNQRIAVPTIQKCHTCWLGNGEYMLFGDGLVRGRKWNEPFPSNVDVLAAISVGDVSPCGTSGRYVCGDSYLVDLRSGDGLKYIEPMSVICYPKTVKDKSGIYDPDPKGSADGTKVCFVSNYDLLNSPVTYLAQDVGKDETRLIVQSTSGFPDSGYINVHREVISYSTKTGTTFEGIKRMALGTSAVRLRAGRVVASFDARLLTDEQWNRTKLSAAMVRSIKDSNSLLLRQRQTDVYITAVKKPDPPYLRLTNDIVEIVPGEHHAETRGYRIWRDGHRFETILRPGQQFTVNKTGSYAAVAVEWSGFASELSAPLKLDGIPGQQVVIKVLERIPRDFSWTEDRWLDKEKTRKERVHRYDGVIRREWYDRGYLVRRHDLNSSGQAIRRTKFQKGKITKREYFSNQNLRVSSELFDDDGFIVETIRYEDKEKGKEIDHWWFSKGWPVQQVRNRRKYIKQGDRFGRLDGDRFIDAPRGAISK